MMKKLLFVWCAFICSLSVYSESGTTGDCTWTFSGGTLTISGSGATGNVTWTEYIPEIKTIRINASVTNVTFKTGSQYTKLTSVYIADNNSSLSITKDAFRGTSLTTVHLGRDLSYDPYSSFIVSNGYYGPFQDIKTLTTLTIGRGVKSIGGYCFDGCTSLSEVNLPFNFETIGEYAFRDCTALVELSTLDHTKMIGQYAFSGCTDLKRADINGDGLIISDYAFSGCTSLEKITLRDGVQYIGYYSFRNCPLTSFVVPASVQEMHQFCKSLDELHIDDGSDEINIAGSPDVQELYIGRPFYLVPPDYWDTYTYAFSSMRLLKRVVFNDSVKAIPQEAFYDCLNLEQVTQGCNVSSIGSFAFSGCTKLTRYISFAPVPPTANSSSGWATFKGMDLANDTLYVPFNSRNLYKTTAPWKDFGTILDVEMLNPDKAGYWSNGYWGYSDKSHTLYVHVEGKLDSTMINEITAEPVVMVPVKDIEYIYLDDGLTSISDWCFYKFTALKGIRIPSSVTEIGEGAFCRCISLVDIDLPPELKKLNSYTFYECTSLPTINIPVAVENIGDYVFTYCNSLTQINVDSKSQYFTSESGVLYNKDKTILISYPAQRIGATYVIPASVQEILPTAFCRADNLITITVPASVAMIGAHAFNYCANLSSISIDDANDVYISFDGVVYDKEQTYMVCYPSGKPGDSYIVPEGIVSLWNGAMAGNEYLKSVTLPSTLASIGSYAFDECHQLKDVYVHAPAIPQTQSYVFNNVPLSEATLHVPSQLVDSYSARSPWRMFGSIVALTEGETGLELLQNGNKPQVVRYFSIEGRSSEGLTRGLNILQMSDGTIQKVFIPSR